MNVVEQINDAITARVSTILGVSYKELDYLINVEKNNFKANASRYGVRPLSSSTVSGVTTYYTFDHEFELIIMTDFKPHPVNDQDMRDKTFILYDKLDEIFKDLFCSKAGLNSIILNIDSMDMDEPDYLEDNVVVIRTKLNVKYRQAVN